MYTKKGLRSRIYNELLHIHKEKTQNPAGRWQRTDKSQRRKQTWLRNTLGTRETQYKTGRHHFSPETEKIFKFHYIQYLARIWENMY